MPIKAVVIAISIVFIMFFTVYLVELIAPLSIKARMNMECRKTLITMETIGSLQSDEIQRLKSELENMGLTNVSVNGPSNSIFGQALELSVQGELQRRGIIALFERGELTHQMSYTRSCISRKVVN